MERKKRRLNGSVKETLRNAFPAPDGLALLQPLVHINCRGWLELENCGSILEYGEGRVVFRLQERCVAVTGEALTIVSLNAHITEIRGRIFRVDLLEAEK